jgi:hypothetical protein
MRFIGMRFNNFMRNASLLTYFASLLRLLTMDIADMGARSSSESSMVSSTFGESTTADFNDDTECLLRLDPAKSSNR